MKIACLCPTYGRPQALIENTIACFLAQTHEDKLLVLCDDTPGRSEQYYGGFLADHVLIMQTTARAESLPSKYNAMANKIASQFAIDAIAVWEDDDVYLPHHLESIAFALKAGDAWYQHPMVYSTYTGKVLQENSKGRFHACLGVSWEAIQKVGGWPNTKRADFDQQLIAKLTELQPRREGVVTYAPSYVFRWNDSGSPHGQGMMRSADDETWYDRFQPQNTEPFVNLAPRFDDSTKAIFAALYIPLPELEGVSA